MAGADQSPTLSSHLICQVRVIRAENVEEIVSSKKLKGGSLFVRTYLSTGIGNKRKARVQLNTRDLLLSSSSESRFTWDESYSLDCRGTPDSVSLLDRGSVTFELRWRPTTRGWAQSSSKLLGTAELPWGPAFSSPDSEIQAWVPLGVSSKAFAGSPAGLLVAMTVKAKAEVAVAPVPSEVERRRRRSECRERSCGCGKDGSCQENYQLFVLAAALDAF